MVIVALALAATVSGASSISHAASTAAALARPTVQLAAVSTSSASLRWTSTTGASGYEVSRGGRVIARLSAVRHKFTETGLKPAAWYAYHVTALRGSQRSAPSQLVPAVTAADRGCTRYVSSSGNDHADGTDSSPWRTVGKLVSAWQPGWVGCLRGAFTEDVSIRVGGTADAPVTVRSDPATGSRAIISGRIWVAHGADHVRIAGLALDGRARLGITAADLPSPTVNANDTVFLDNDVYNYRTRICFDIGSIRGYGTAVGTIIARNRIHDCGGRDASGAGNNHHHGIYVESGRATRIVQNAIYQNADRGIQLYPDAQGTLVMGNVIDGNGEGIIFSGGDGYVSSLNRVIANVVTNSRTRYDVEYFWDPARRVGVGNVVARNCVGGGRWGAIAVPAKGYVLAANITAKPAFVSRLTGDLRPRLGSECASLLLSPTTPLQPYK
ncbi:MAG: hypothetical protein JWN41_742 [Thermoleophilia bacterium]|nr:hypothetical protein [Thermoleophilia bacterium]